MKEQKVKPASVCIIAMSTKKLKKPYVEGSTKHPCRKCGVKVWVSPETMAGASRAAAAATPRCRIQFSCVECSEKDEDLKPQNVAPVTVGQLTEIANAK